MLGFLVLQALIELLFNLLFWLPWDVLLGFWSREPSEEPPKRKPKPLPELPSAWSLPLLGASLGIAAGGMSLLVLPSAVLHHAYGRVANLLLTPLLCGLAARWLALRRAKRGEVSDAKKHFWFAIGFSLAFAVFRFVWAETGL